MILILIILSIFFTNVKSDTFPNFRMFLRRRYNPSSVKSDSEVKINNKIQVFEDGRFILHLVESLTKV